jgi:PAS domain S-box-containing protein
MTFEKYRELFEALPSPYMILDTDLRYVAANQAYAEATNHAVSELIGQKLFDLFPNEGEAGQRLQESFLRVIRSGRSDTLAHIHYAIPASNGDGFEDRYWTAVHFPIQDENGHVTHVVQNTVDVTELHQLNRNSFLPFRSPRIETELIKRAQEAEEVHRALVDENNDFRRLFDQAPGMIAVLNGPDHVFTFVNEAYTRFVGGRHVVGKPVRKALPEIEGQGFIEMLDNVLATGEPISLKGASVYLRPNAGGEPIESFLDFSYHPIFDKLTEQPTGIFVQGLDRTENIKAENARELLLRELNHRVKNLFAVAMSMVNMTARNAGSPAEMASILTGRLGALSHAHGLVMSDGDIGEGARICFGELIRKIVAPHLDIGAERLTTEGPELALGSKAATSLALVTHELATNAAKYGAFSTPEGRIAVRWAIEGDTVSIVWKETGGPPIVSAPEPTGFGSRLSRISVEGQLGGKLAFDWTRGGVEVTITFPLASTRQ